MTQGDNLSVAIQHNTDTAAPAVLVMPGHPTGCTCGDDPDIQMILGGGISLKDTLELCELVVKALREQTVADPETGELHF